MTADANIEAPTRPAGRGVATPSCCESSNRQLAADIAAAVGALLSQVSQSSDDPGAGTGGAAEPSRGELARSPGTMARCGSRLVGQLLSYAGRQALAPSRLELLPFIRDLAHTLSHTLDTRVHVSVDVRHDCPPCAADRPALEEAVLVLVRNARDSMPEGGRLQLSAHADLSADGLSFVAVAVTDSGIGMDADFAQRAAQPFVTTSVHDPLAGMGLAAADGFARQSGGRMTMSSRVGFGTTVTLVLPIWRRDSGQP